MDTDSGRVGKPTGLSQVEPQEGLAPPGFDPSRIMQEYYLSRYYEPNYERPADNVLAAIEFTIDRFFSGERIASVGAAEAIGIMTSRILSLAPSAGLYVSIKIEPARDSDGSPEGGDGEAGSVRSTTARAEGIARKEPS